VLSGSDQTADGLEDHQPSEEESADDVTRPDEYSTIANNKIYSNLVVQKKLQAAADAVERHPDRARELGVGPDEVAAWRDTAWDMLGPYDEVLGVHPQAKQFTEHAVWDFAHEPRSVPADAALS
jgi:alpha,alpha-trehalose phosphorylase